MEAEELKAKIKSVIEIDCEIFVAEYGGVADTKMGDWYAILGAKKYYHQPDGRQRQVKIRMDGDVNVLHDKETLTNIFVEDVYGAIQKGYVKIDEDRPEGFGFTSIKTYEEIQQTEK